MNRELIAVLGLLITNAGFLFGMWKHFDARIGRVYARMDENKEYAKKNFVEKDMCKVLHDQTTVTSIGLEQRLGDRIEKLETKFDKIIELLTKGGV